MTLLDFEELAGYWSDYPPVHILVAAYLGLGKEKRTRMPLPGSGGPPRPDRAADLEAASILAELGSGFGCGDVHDGLAPVVLDFAELQRKAAMTG